MTMMRTPLIRRALPASAAFMFLILAFGLMGRALGGPSAWQDHANGFAIGGFDPVAYFTRHKPAPGREGIEHRWGGANWRFTNTGNRDAFAKHPAIYAPQFAGYDCVALSKGLSVHGNPTLWVVYAKRTYLFADKKNLQTWRQNKDRILQSARANWATLGGNMPGTSENKKPSSK